MRLAKLFSFFKHDDDDAASSYHIWKNFFCKIKSYFERHENKEGANNAPDLNGELTASYRNIDGSDNNPNYSEVGQVFLRKVPSDYANNESEPSGADRPNPRHISNEIFAQSESEPEPSGVSDMFWLWGQFLDHDIDLTGEDHEGEAFNIQVPTGDPYFDPFFTGMVEIPLTRSGFEEGTGENGVPREQTNEITPFIDASNVYGVDEARLAFMRADGGKLKVTESDYGDLLPYNTAMLPNAGGPSDTLFVAGDVRANENVALTSMHTLFVREHNRLVDEIAKENPHFTDEQLFQEAKVLVEALMQQITYHEFLPLLVGEDALDAYTGFDAAVNPEIANVFATAAFRLGHTLLSNEVERIDEEGNEIEAGHLLLKDAFFAADEVLLEEGIESIFRGMSEGYAEALDTQLVDAVRNFLFGPPGAGGLDLASLNIQRGRDHGLSDYNSVREAYGLDRVESFSDITSDTELAAKLEDVFGDVDSIDVFVGGLAEDAVNGGLLGELFHTIVVDQFTRLRDGDKYWYEDRLSESQLDWVQSVKLSDIIEWNTDVEIIQSDVMLAYERIVGTKHRDKLVGTDESDLIIGGKGKDILKGMAGNDELHGGKGRDVMYGGEGEDRFVFTYKSGKDTIKDFEQGIDKIDLTDFHITFDDLHIKEKRGDITVRVDAKTQIHLDDVGNMINLDESDFIF